MKIYVAGSFKNRAVCRMIGRILRANAFDVYVFCDEDAKAYPYSMRIRENNRYMKFTPKIVQTDPDVRCIYSINMQELCNTDVVLLVLPSGKSAHMEAGWIKGVDGKLLIYGPMHEGEFDAMYGMADGIYDVNEWDNVVNHLDAIQRELEVGA